MAKAEPEFALEDIKAFAWHLRVQGAYVQQPVPAIYGLEDDIVIGSNDANALYPISIMHQNIGFDTLNTRLYDAGTITPLLGLIETVFKRKKNDPLLVNSALDGFKAALTQTTKDYFMRKTVQKKKEVLEFTVKYYGRLLEKILKYPGELKDIFHPIDDETYFLLKSCLYPVLETVSWLSPQNRGYNHTIVEYVFHNEEYLKKPKKIYCFRNLNSTKTTFEILEPQAGIDLFKTKILNPYGVLFDKHKDNLAFDVTLIKAGLKDRREIKNRAQVIGAVLSQIDKLSKDQLNYFVIQKGFMSEDQANEILETIKDTENRKSRIESLTTIEYEIESIEDIEPFLKLREAQFNSMQQGIKVTLNSLYGIYGLITWSYASPIIGNAITTAGKIYGIKLFQAVTTNIIGDLNDKINRGEYDGITTYQR